MPAGTWITFILELNSFQIEGPPLSYAGNQFATRFPELEASAWRGTAKKTLISQFASQRIWEIEQNSFLHLLNYLKRFAWSLKFQHAESYFTALCDNRFRILRKLLKKCNTMAIYRKILFLSYTLRIEKVGSSIGEKLLVWRYDVYRYKLQA